MIEVETNSVEVKVVDSTEATSTGNVNIDIVDLDDLDITVAKKEYVITGDSIYIPVLYTDAPQWMKDLVDLSVEVSMDTANATTLNQVTHMLSQFATSYVPLNRYTQSIADLSDEDTRLNLVIETLNSNFNDGLNEANAHIIDMNLTKASKSEVVAQVVNTLAAELASPTSNLGATIASLNQAIVTERTARADSMDVLTAHIESVDDGVTANAEVINTALAYVGIDEAGAETGSGLSSYLVDSSGNVGGATSKVANSVYTDAQGNVKSKYEYNSTVSVNGVSYSSGFGLSNSAGTGIGSEFWIDASRLKFTNSNMTGQTAPFTIDATGTQPQITFNGKVSFSNVTGYTAPDVAGSISSNNDILAQKLGYANYAEMVTAANNGQTIINGGYLRTNLIQAGAITAGLIDANAISGKTISGGLITGTNIYGANIEGSVIKASFIDLTSTATLTNWQQYTPSNYPSQYASNFAHKNDGSLLVDSLGYVRLMGNTNVVGTSYYFSGQNYPGAPTLFDITVSAPLTNANTGIRSYNSYTTSSSNRCITVNPTFTLSGFSSSSYKNIVRIYTATQSGGYVNFSMILFGDSIILSGSTVTVNGSNIPSSGAYGVPNMSNKTSVLGFNYRIGFYYYNNMWGLTIDSNTFTFACPSFTGSGYPIEIITSTIRCISTGANGAIYGYLIDIPAITVT